MKKVVLAVFILIASAVLAIFYIKDDKNPAQQYGNTMVESAKSARKLDASVNVQQVRKSVQEFYAANSRFPADLDELAAFNGMMLKSDKYVYDPATGNITEKLQ